MNVLILGSGGREHALAWAIAKSPACGRLMCSLRYEHDFYAQARKRFPKEGRKVRTSAGEEEVVGVNIFANRVTLRGTSGELRTVALEDLKRETAEARRSARNN